MPAVACLSRTVSFSKMSADMSFLLVFAALFKMAVASEYFSFESSHRTDSGMSQKQKTSSSCIDDIMHMKYLKIKNVESSLPEFQVISKIYLHDPVAYAIEAVIISPIA